MNRTEWTSAHAAALAHFFETFGTETAAELAAKINCTEAESLARLMNVSDRHDLAAIWINAHSHGDDEGDRHHRTPAAALRYELDELAATVAGVELDEADPDAFGLGHLVLTRNGSEYLALTEYTDTDDADTIAGWIWEQKHRSPSGGPLHNDTVGRYAADDVDDLVRLAWEWATH